MEYELDFRDIRLPSVLAKVNLTYFLHKEIASEFVTTGYLPPNTIVKNAPPLQTTFGHSNHISLLLLPQYFLLIKRVNNQ